MNSLTASCGLWVFPIDLTQTNLFWNKCEGKLTLLLFLSPPGNYTQSYVKVSWMWPFPVSSPWTVAVTPHLLPLHLIPPPHPPRSPPTPAPLPNWEDLLTWALSLDCKHTSNYSPRLLVTASTSSVLTPKLCQRSSTCQRAEPLIVPSLSRLEGVILSMEITELRRWSLLSWLCIIWMWGRWWTDEKTFGEFLNEDRQPSIPVPSPVSPQAD